MQGQNSCIHGDYSTNKHNCWKLKIEDLNVQFILRSFDIQVLIINKLFNCLIFIEYSNTSI